MPTAQIGDKISLDRREFLELKSKGEKIKIRIANADYYYEGKHFFQHKNGDWTVESCPRVNEKLDCEDCEEYFKLIKQVKELRTEGDEKKAKDLEKKARNYKANVSFYYPVLDRETGLAGVFRTTLSTRLKLEDYKEDGVDILKFDFIVKRTEKPGSDYYSLTRVDSADTPALTKDEKQELKKAQEFKLEEVVAGPKGSMKLGTEVKEADEEDDDIPF
jgi:hypothetical protein